MFADDTVVVGLIFGNGEKAYLEEVANLSFWYQDCLMLNVSKTKEHIVHDLYSRRCRTRACRIMKDPHQSNN